MKKIMFKDKYGLTDAVLNGTKTQTRRFPIPRIIEEYNDLLDTSYNVGVPCSIVRIEDFLLEHAPYKVGEIVAVAQSYDQVIKISDEKKQEEVFGHMHRYGFAGLDNKMFVKAKLMPHQIKITNVRVQRLQDITHEECLLEGVYILGEDDMNNLAYLYTYDGTNKAYFTAREAYKDLINDISGKRTWENNPYVFAYDFELVK